MARQELMAKRDQMRATRSRYQQIRIDLLTLRYQILAWIEGRLNLDLQPVGHFLKQYMGAVHATAETLAQDIALSPRQITSILEGQSRLSLSLAYRLARHSGDMLSAHLWWRLAQHELELAILAGTAPELIDRQMVMRVGFEQQEE